MWAAGRGDVPRRRHRRRAREAALSTGARPGCPVVHRDRLGADLQARAPRTAPDRASTRRSFAATWPAGRRRLAAGMAKAGLAVAGDGGGSVVGRWEGAAPGLPPLMVGSPTGTVAGGGWFEPTAPRGASP